MSIFFTFKGREVRVPSASAEFILSPMIRRPAPHIPVPIASQSNKQEHDDRPKVLPPLFLGVVFTSNSTLTLALPCSDSV